jgi:hypothetical protein
MEILDIVSTDKRFVQTAIPIGEFVRKYLADQGFVAVERELADKLAGRAYQEGPDAEIKMFYNPTDDCYVSKAKK